MATTCSTFTDLVPASTPPFGSQAESPKTSFRVSPFKTPPCAFTCLAAMLRPATIGTTSSAIGPVTPATEPSLTSPAVAPDAVIIDRTNVNAWEEAEFVEAVKAMGRKKLIMGGLWTDVCLAYPAIEAERAGRTAGPSDADDPVMIRVEVGIGEEPIDEGGAVPVQEIDHADRPFLRTADILRK